jgi:DNA polymerase I-like protein with 3'-5' exonuclease and polymerase domains
VAQGVRTAADLKQLVKDYSKFDELVIDVETMGDHRLDPQRNVVFWVSLGGPGRADAIPCGHPIGERVTYLEDDDTHRVTDKGKYQERRINETSKRLKWFDLPLQYTPAPSQLWVSDVAEALAPLLFSDRRKIGHRVKFDLESMAKYYNGELPPPPYGDTIVAARLVDETQLAYRLGDCVRREFKYTYNKKIGKSVETHPYSVAHLYSYLDAKYEWVLWQALKEKLRQQKLMPIFDLEMELLPVIMDMEMSGTAIDEEVLNALGDEFSRELAALQLAINQRAGKPINLNADRQVGELVYDILGKTCRVYTPSGQRSTSRETLEAYRKNKTVANILEFSSLNKLQGTFIEGLRRNLVDGRVYPDFNQVGARSGRTSCSEPNVQQIPVRSERGKRVRDVFIASEGCVLVVADLSQIELRVLAHYTQDKVLLKAYEDGISLHALLAQAVFGKDYTPLQYAFAKNGNFSCLFGGSAATIYRRYDFPSIRVAQKVIDGFYGTYRSVKPWKAHILERARNTYRKGKQQPYVETILGRRRRLPELHYLDWGKRAAAERQAISTVISGSAADLFKVIMINTHRNLLTAGFNGHILMTVHDELVVEVPAHHQEEGLDIVKSTMENEALNPFTREPLLTVPIVADAKIVGRWSEAKG